MDTIFSYFEGYPAQLKVARMILVRGISVIDGKAMCGGIEQSDSAIARAAGVDRRVVRTTIEHIMSVEELAKIFSNVKPMLNMSDMASMISCTSIDIIPTDSKVPGILASITARLFESGYCIRQIVINEDEDWRATLSVVIEGVMAPDDIAALKNCTGVDKVVLK